MKIKRIIKTKEFFFLVIVLMIFSLSSFVAFKFDSITTQIGTVARKLYLATVDVSGMEISSLLIDVTNGNTEYTTSYEWNSVDKNEKRNIIYQINYKNNDVSKSYNPGDLELKVPNFLYEFEGAQSYYFNKYFHNIDISADLYSSSPKNHDWSYQYSSDSNYIILTNNNKIELNSNFEGSIQISYVLTSIDLYKSINKNIVTTLNNTKSTNTILFKSTTNKRTYSLTSSHYKMNSLDGLPSGDYIWVKTQIITNETSDGVRYLNNKTNGTNKPIFYVDVPEDVILLGDDFNELSKNSSNEYYFDVGGGSVCDTDVDSIYEEYWICMGVSSQTIYIGMPRTLYYDEIVSYSVSLEGIYTKTNKNLELDIDNDGYEEVAEMSNTIKVSSFVFNYTGELYSVEKSPQNTNIDISDVSTSY